MKEVVRNISNKSGRAKIFCFVLCFFVVLLLGVGVYSVFGGGEPSGYVLDDGGSSYWEKSGIGKVEWDLHVTDSCVATRYLNITSYLASQDLDVCVRTNRPLSNSYSDAWLWKNMSNDVIEQVWVNTSTCDGNCSETGYYEEVVIGEEWYPNWFNIKDKFTHYSYNGNEYYCLKGVYAEQNKKYEFKIKMAFPMNWKIRGCNEKFGLIAKRSSESLQDAISLEHYVELDPVFDNSDTLQVWLKMDNDWTDSANGSNQAGANDFNSAGGPSFTTNVCKSGSCGVWNGTQGDPQSYISYYDFSKSLLLYHTPWTFCYWLMVTPSADFSIFGYGDSTNYVMYRTWGDTDELNGYDICNAGGTCVIVNTNVSGQPTNVWVYECLTWDTVDGEFWHDVVESGREYVGLTQWQGNNNSFVIGRPLADDGDQFTGYIDEFTYWNATLTEEDMQTLYDNNGVPPASNTAPSDPVVSISPLNGYRNVDVYCTATVNDTDVETDLTVCVDLFENNVTVMSRCGLSVENNVDFNYTITADGNFSVGEEWGCGARVYDQIEYSNWVNATQFTVIQNRPPNFDPISDITMDEDFANFTIDLNANISDPDDLNTDLQISYDLNVSDIIVDVVNGTNILTVASFTPDWSGSVNIILTVVDTGGLTNSTSFDLIVIPVNDAPDVIDGNSSSLERPWVNYTNETEVDFQENDTVRLEVGAEDVEGDTIWYDWFVDGALELADSLVNYFDFVTDFTSAGVYNVTVHAKDFSGWFSFFEWFVTVENVNIPNFAVNFADPTPNDGEIVHTDYVDLKVELVDSGVGPFEQFVLFDNSTLNFSQGSFENTQLLEGESFVNLSVGSFSGSFTSVIFDSVKNTTWDNLSWGGVLPTDEEITPDENTVLLYHLNNDSGYGENDTHVYDFSSNGNNGTSIGASPNLSGKVGGGFKFDGVDDYVKVKDDPSLDVTNNLTLEAWIRPDVVTGTPSILSKYNDMEGGGPIMQYNMRLTDSKLRVYLSNDGSTSNNFTGATTLVAGNWYHVAFTFSRPTLKVYVNGVEDGSFTWDYNIYAGDALFTVGGQLWNGAIVNEFDGTIDEASVWNRALTAEEILSHASLKAVAGSIRLQVRSCDDMLCDGETFKGPTGESDYYETSVGEDLNVGSNRFFQYKAFLETSNASYSPELYNVTVEGKNLALDTVWVDWNGENITLDGSGLSWSKTLTGLTEGDYIYRVYANDTYDNSNTTEERTVTVEYYDISFNVTSGEDGSPINGLDSITCDYASFIWDFDLYNPYGPYKFPSGSWSCVFKEDLYWNGTVNFIADNHKTVDVVIPWKGGLSWEEHSQLDWLYNCWHDGDCWNLLEYINQTTSNLWDNFKRTDDSVILKEEMLSNELNSTDNIKYNYTIYIPEKAGYRDGDLLPVRMFFWFVNATDNLTCYNQGYKENETAETPICQPLMAEILGPMNDNISFVVDLKPGLPQGVYNVIRAVEIDPNGEWINYGQEIIGQITVAEDNDEASINIEEVKMEVVEQTEQKVEEKISEPEGVKQAGEEKESETGLSKITGNVVSDILSSTKINLVIGLLVAILFVLVCLTFRVSKLTYRK